MDPLEVFREALALFRRAGLGWIESYPPALDAALSVVRREYVRGEWQTAIESTKTNWMRAFERRDIVSPLERYPR